MKVWARAVVTLTLFGVIAWVVPWPELWGHARQLDPGVWLGVLGLVLLAHLLGVFKWRLAVNVGRARLGGFDATQCYTAGLFANMCLPSIIGGDALRAVLAGRITRRYEAVVVGGLADRFLDVAALTALAAVGAWLSRDVLPAEVVIITGLGLALVLMAGVVAAVAMRRFPLRRWPARHARVLLRALVAVRRLLRAPAPALLVLLSALTIQATFALLNAWLGHSVGIDVPVAVWFFAFPLAKLASSLPVSIAGFGVREASLAGLLLLVSVPAEQGVLVSLVWGTMLIATGIAGGACWFALGWRKRARTGAGHGSLLDAARTGKSAQA